MTFRLLHSSDLHLGKRFGNLPEDVRGRLREARHAAIDRLASRARDVGATVILLAGDTFDTETPAADVRRQALAAMKHHAPLQWVLLPGNHDSLQAAALWASLESSRPENVLLATEAEPLMLAPDVALLAAPCTARRPGRDLTSWMDEAATPNGTIRLGLAHGAIQDFSEESDAIDVIAPDRAARSGLDYLALGDWHGTVAVSRRTFYSGSPEPDRFKHNAPGQALVVSIAAAGAEPDVTAVETGAFHWRTVSLELLPSEEIGSRLAGLLPPPAVRRHTLMRIGTTGHVTVSRHAALKSAVEEAAPEFARLELDLSNLMIDCETDDLDSIDRAGALRNAAEELLTESLDSRLSDIERDIARQALVRLFAFSQRTAL